MIDKIIKAGLASVLAWSRGGPSELSLPASHLQHLVREIDIEQLNIDEFKDNPWKSVFNIGFPYLLEAIKGASEHPPDWEGIWNVV